MELPNVDRQIHEPLPMSGGTPDKIKLVNSDREDSSFGALPYQTIVQHQENKGSRNVPMDGINISKVGKPYMFGWSGRDDNQQRIYLQRQIVQQEYLINSTKSDRYGYTR